MTSIAIFGYELEEPALPRIDDEDEDEGDDGNCLLFKPSLDVILSILLFGV